MMENRLRKLQNEEARLQRQIKIANKHSEFADQVRQRRETDNNNKNAHKAWIMQKEEEQRQLNYERRANNKANISSHQNKILMQNATTRDFLKE